MSLDSFGLDSLESLIDMLLTLSILLKSWSKSFSFLPAILEPLVS